MEQEITNDIKKIKEEVAKHYSELWFDIEKKESSDLPTLQDVIEYAIDSFMAKAISESRNKNKVNVFQNTDKNIKVKIKDYADAVVVKIPNKKIMVVERSDENGISYFMNFKYADKDADKPACTHKCHRGIVRETTVKVSEDGMDALIMAYIRYKRNKQAKQAKKTA
jgi:predicted DNA binding protein